jgi:hypothetical protein
MRAIVGKDGALRGVGGVNEVRWWRQTRGEGLWGRWEEISEGHGYAGG